MRAEIIRGYNRRAKKFDLPLIRVPPIGFNFLPDMETMRENSWMAVERMQVWRMLAGLPGRPDWSTL